MQNTGTTDCIEASNRSDYISNVNIINSSLSRVTNNIFCYTVSFPLYSCTYYPQAIPFKCLIKISKNIITYYILCYKNKVCLLAIICT